MSHQWSCTCDPEVSICVLSDDFDGPWVQVYGTAEVLDMPEAAEPFVDYFRSIAGEHPDWDEYRQAMAELHQLGFTSSITADSLEAPSAPGCSRLRLCPRSRCAPRADCNRNLAPVRGPARPQRTSSSGSPRV